LREYFCETFGITGVRPVFIDDSGMVIWMLDDRDIMFQWNDMEQSMNFLGINLKEGLTNCLYHPEKICSISESTGSLIPVNILSHYVQGM
ncbi:14201_t:CDS:1, partial [Funneliformis geosporum]